MGHDESAVLTLEPGNHLVRIENRFLGAHEAEIVVTDGQSGMVKIEW